jgi:diacylglycerol kinase (ATP)
MPRWAVRAAAAGSLVPQATRLERFSIRARFQSIRFALRGIGVMLRSQHNAWVHAVATVGALTAGFLFEISRIEWLAITLAIVAVWTAEALNTAFESLCDVASPEFHPMVERAKDVAAGAVLISAIGAVFVALLVFGPRLLALGA